MKTLLLLCCLSLTFAAVGQSLPVDSVSGKVTYSGVVDMPGVGANELFQRAKAFGLAASVAPMVNEPGQQVLSIWEKQLFSGAALNKQSRILRYQVAVYAKDGRYRYVISDLENKTMPVSYRNPATGVMMTAPGGQAPLERVLANPNGYKHGQPTAALLSYQAAISSAAQQAVADVRQRMQGGATGGNW